MTRVLPLVALLLVPGPAGAAEPPRQQPVNLRADRIEVNQKTGISRYLGKVLLTQGTVRISADRAEARALNQGLERVTASGRPVTFRDRLPDGSGFIEGEARNAEYRVVAQQLHLHDQVVLRRERDVLRAGRMRYDIELKTVHAERDGDQRVIAALVPRRRLDGDETP